MKKTITLKINGEKRTIDVNPAEKLLDVIRDKLGVKSPKYGCGRGECGACNVLLNGKSVRSCIILAVEADGAEILTLEGIADEVAHVQEAFIRHNSFQCGFCAPGMIISVYELLRKNPGPNVEEIKEAISGNLCRCTGYTPIIDAILDVVTTTDRMSETRNRRLDTG